MNKSSFFTGQPIFSQLIKLLPKRDIERIAREYGADRYCKKFDTWHHVLTMLYCSYQNCTSLREVSTGMSACEGRLQSTGIKHFARRSTLSDANKRRNAEVFEKIYQRTYARLSGFLPDSRLKGTILNKLTIVDSTTISLFNDIYKGPGRNPGSGKKKGGVKVHMAVQASQDVPCLVRITAASSNDKVFFPFVKLAKGSYVVFDKGYLNHTRFNQFTRQGIYWVTRQRDDGVIEASRTAEVSEQEEALGVKKDERIVMGSLVNHIEKVPCRRIVFHDKVDNKTYEFITNNYRIKASTVASIYKRRWQIELLFKRLKQNMPLQYFLGDNQNAIQIQIWCTLLADLLLKVSTRGIKRSWAFSNLSSLIRLHLMNYTNLKKFLNDPDKARITMPALPNDNAQLRLFSDG